MDPTPIRIVVQQAWKPEVIKEESEEELEAFNRDQQLPSTATPVIKPRINVVHLEVPKPQLHKRSRSNKKRRAANSVRKVAKTMQFVTKWAKRRKKSILRQLERETFMNKAPVVRPSYSIDEHVEKTWILNYLPLTPTSSILYW